MGILRPRPGLPGPADLNSAHTEAWSSRCPCHPRGRPGTPSGRPPTHPRLWAHHPPGARFLHSDGQRGDRLLTSAARPSAKPPDAAGPDTEVPTPTPTLRDWWNAATPRRPHAAGTRSSPQGRRAGGGASPGHASSPGAAVATPQEHYRTLLRILAPPCSSSPAGGCLPAQGKSYSVGR